MAPLNKTYVVTHAATGRSVRCSASNPGGALVALLGLCVSAEEVQTWCGEISRGEWVAEAVLSRTAAARQASSESSMYHQGGGWIVSTWDSAMRLNRLTEELPFWAARLRPSAWRRERADALQGLAEEE